MKIGLALGGGGARALAHIGALKALEELNIKIDYIAGTSLGALVGGLYALKPDARLVENLIKDSLHRYKNEINSLKSYGADSSVEDKKLFLEKSFRFVKSVYLWNLKIVKSYMVKPKPFFRIFKSLLKNYQFGNCKIPFLCAVVDIMKADVAVIDKGSLFKGVAASCALPGIFPPVKTRNNLFVDGGVLAPLPARMITGYVDFTIGVGVEESFHFSPDSIKNVLDMLFTVDRIRYKKIIEQNQAAADFLIMPDVANYSWSDFGCFDDIIEAGYVQTLKKKSLLLKAIARAKRLSFWGIKKKRVRSYC